MKKIIISAMLGSIVALSTSVFATSDFSYVPTDKDKEIVERVGQKLEGYLFESCRDKSEYTCKKIVAGFFKALRRVGATSEKMYYITESIIPNLSLVQNPVFSITVPSTWKEHIYKAGNCDYLLSGYEDRNSAAYWHPNARAMTYNISNSDVDECIEFDVKRVSGYEYESIKHGLLTHPNSGDFKEYITDKGSRELLYPGDGLFSAVYMVKYSSSVYGDQYYQVSLGGRIFQNGVECERMSDCYNKKNYTESDELRDIIKNTLTVK